VKVWDTNYENDIDDDTAGSLIDDNIRTLKSEIRKRLETFFDNWANDPDAPTTLDVKDDAILAEHISGLTGTGAVDTDNIPEGSTNKYFSDKTLDDLPDGSTYKKVAGVNASNLITASSILDNAVGLDALDTSGWEYGTFDLGGSGDTLTIPKGLYYVFDPDYVELHVYYGDGSTYKNLGAPSDPMFLLSDGSYVKLYSVGSSSAHLAYIKITA